MMPPSHGACQSCRSVGGIDLARQQNEKRLRNRRARKQSTSTTLGKKTSYQDCALRRNTMTANCWQATVMSDPFFVAESFLVFSN